MRIKGLPKNVPWITKDGHLDATKFPLDGILDRMVNGNDEDRKYAVGLLNLMHNSGRKEAGIFLMGYLISMPDDWKKKEEIVFALAGFNTKECTELLFSELRRVKSSNTTRGYLTTILHVLSKMPLELVEAGFNDLAEDKRFTYRMRNKFKEIPWRIRERESRW